MDRLGQHEHERRAGHHENGSRQLGRGAGGRAARGARCDLGDAVDTEPHEVVALAQVGPNRNRIQEAVRRVVSAGGGIVVREGLRAGLKQLERATTGTRHMILFADANDSREQLGDYLDAVDELRKADVTVSVIGLGTESDRDADILKTWRSAAAGGFFSAPTRRSSRRFLRRKRFRSRGRLS